MKRDKLLDYLIAIVVVFIFVIPFIKLFIRSFQGDGLIINYSKIFSDKRVIKGIINTFIIGISSSFITLIVGSYLAFIIAYTNIRFKGLLKVLVYLPFIVPSYIMTLAWTNITSNVGIVTKLLKSVGLKPINLYSIGGIVFLMLVCYTPFVYLSVYRSLIKVPLSNEHASKLLNYGSFETFRNINLRQITPTLVSTFVLVFLSSLDNFSIPAFLGVPAGISVLSTLIYEKTISISTGGFTDPAVLSALLFIISVSVSGIESSIIKRSRTGKDSSEDTQIRYSFKPKTRSFIEVLTFLVFIFINIVPIGFMIYSSLVGNYVDGFSFSNLSLDNYRSLFSISSIKMSITNSLTYALITVIICAFLSIIYAYFKWKKKFDLSISILEKATSISYSLPGMVLALCMIFHWAKPIPGLNIGFYASSVIILIAYVSRFLIIDMKSAYQGFSSISTSLEYAAVLSNRSSLKKWTEIFLPLIYKYVLTSSLLIFVYSLSELSLSAILSGPFTKTIGLFIFNLQQAGDYNLAYAMSTLVLIVLLAMYILMEKINSGGKNEFSN
ncbi:ABC transporter permease [Peptoniphilus catoniae]|uniref:ABC transporter permease n=1 Tax=Peptoniphilus catoniae TaxID=1660341 RepID=UPI0010FE1BAC|nr:iron ABC transporter permease [Peptoniphilus catoniae]